MTSEATVVAVIPARGGSKGIPRKNVQTVGGVPLVGRAIRSSASARSINKVYVSTDDTEIANLSIQHGAAVIRRPDALSGDTSSSESAIEHALNTLISEGQAPDIIVLIQATSPFIDSADLDAAVERVRDGSYDVVFSAIDFHGFVWREEPNGADGVNHERSVRLRRQDRPSEFLETGAFYVMNTSGFLHAKHRFFGRVGIQLVSRETSIEIDDRSDLEIARAIAATRQDQSHRITARALVMDFDGVHTDNKVLVDDRGNEHATVNRSDGMGIELLKAADIPLLILSKEQVPIVARRAEKLAIDVAYGIEDKAAYLRRWCQERDIPLTDVAYVGNDINDVGPMRIVGWPIAVADAHRTALLAARTVLQARGGEGAIREIADRMLLASP